MCVCVVQKSGNPVPASDNEMPSYLLRGKRASLNGWLVLVIVFGLIEKNVASFR